MLGAMDNDVIAGAVLVLVSLPLFALFAHSERKHRRLARIGRGVEGTCRVSAKAHSGSGGVVHFVDHHGTYHRLPFMFRAPAPDRAKVTVFYDPETPHVAVVAEARFSHVGFLLLGLIPLAAGANWLVQGVMGA